MEDYRNRVIKLHAIHSMIISKFTSELYLEEPPKVIRGGHGGPTPASLSRLCSPP